jgi:NAD(P)-dependent dehydrogenase (short-subunit alcohol dehydrogenase family)
MAREADVEALVTRAEEAFGRIDLFCSNAGIIVDGGVEVPDDAWSRIWAINVQSHVYAARALLPGMLARKQGYLIITASAAGLLTQLGSAPYAVTKHAAVALAEWLSVTYGEQGLIVSALCPQAVTSNLAATSRRELGDAALPADIGATGGSRPTNAVAQTTGSDGCAACADSSPAWPAGRSRRPASASAEVNRDVLESE